MTRLLKLHILVGFAIWMLLPAVAARGQIVQLLASWEFEPGAFLTDSSGNGNVLVNGAGANAATPSPDVMDPAVSSQSAFFDGDA